jgi:3-oxoacyl-[acyl-carrier-protein] synthase-3
VNGHAISELTGVGIAGTASVPDACGRAVTNDEVDRLVLDHGGRVADPDWLERNGLDTRRWTAEPGGQRRDGAPETDQLLTVATQRALDAAGVPASDVDVLVTATTTPSRYTSAMATAVSGRLGITGMALDVRAGCPSALHAFVVAANQLRAGASVAVVAAAEALSGVAPGVGPLAYLAGDAAAAVVLTATDDPSRGILGGWVGNDGTVSDQVGTPGSLPPSPATGDGDFRLRFGDRYDDVSRTAWGSIGRAAVDAAGVEPHRIGAFVSNQAGRERVRGAAEAAGVCHDAVVDVMGVTANAGSASFLVALDEAHRRQRAQAEPWLLVSVGGGLSYLGVVIRP